MSGYTHILFDVLGVYAGEHASAKRKNRGSSTVFGVQDNLDVPRELFPDDLDVSDLYVHALKGAYRIYDQVVSKYAQGTPQVWLLQDPLPGEFRDVRQDMPRTQRLHLDEPHLLARKRVLGQYKQGRKRWAEDFVHTASALSYLLLCEGEHVRSVSGDFIEADDWVKPVLDHIFSEHPDARVLMVSPDGDWDRYLADNVHRTPGFKGADLLTPDTFESRYKFRPTYAKVVMLKSIRGDHSDSIPPGIPGVRAGTLLDILERYTSVKDLLVRGRVDEKLPHPVRMALEVHAGQLAVNERVVSAMDIDHRLLSQYTSLGQRRERVATLFRGAIGRADPLGIDPLFSDVVLADAIPDKARKASSAHNLQGFSFGGVKAPKVVTR